MCTRYMLWLLWIFLRRYGLLTSLDICCRNVLLAVDAVPAGCFHCTPLLSFITHHVLTICHCIASSCLRAPRVVSSHLVLGVVSYVRRRRTDHKLLWNRSSRCCIFRCWMLCKSRVIYVPPGEHVSENNNVVQMPPGQDPR